MEEKEKLSSGICFPQLYYRYKRISDDKIREYLKRIKIVAKRKNGSYHLLDESAMNKIIDRPRNISLTFNATRTKNSPIKDLTEYKTIKFLVKSSSRFFLKPDIGEILDQIESNEFYPYVTTGYSFDVICMEDDYETIVGTDGEHFLMR